MAGVIEGPTTEAKTSSAKAARIAYVDVVRDLAAVESTWRTLEQPGELSTPYQRFDLLNAWQRHVGTSEGRAPFIVVASDAERRPLLLMPLALEHRAGIRIARFLGGKHTTFNMPLWQRDFAQTATSTDLATLIAGLRSHGEADVLALTQQPSRWLGLANPMRLLTHQESVNDCPLLTMEPGAAPKARISSSFRRRLNGKERKLQVLPGYRYCLASTDAEITRLLDAFFRIKPVRMAAQKLPDVFADPGVEGFIRDACAAKLSDGSHAIEIHALECDDEMIAIFAGVADGDRFSMMFNTYTLSENARYSPGLILMRNIIDYYADLGYSSLDLGIGSDDYKLLFCKGLEPIFDSYIALSARGQIAATALSSMARAKRLIKQTPALMQFAQRVRGALHR
jgi:CelD/BcsL family acetyltransferase involved in cellulose biosynthesis